MRTPYSGIAVYSDQDASVRTPARGTTAEGGDRQRRATDDDEFFWGDGWAEIAGMSFGRRDPDDEVVGSDRLAERAAAQLEALARDIRSGKLTLTEVDAARGRGQGREALLAVILASLLTRSADRESQPPTP